jgi:two-component system chemotaxis sensor kinase CheA
VKRRADEAIETLLLELEEQPDNRELLDNLFRCAHTVKGSAGIFGLNKVVEFTHHVETLLDKLRDGEIHLTPAISTLLLQCNDQIKFLVDTAAHEEADTPDQKDLRADLVIPAACLHRQCSGSASCGGRGRPAGASGSEPPLGLTDWKISARFGQETFRNGMDPLSIARYLRSGAVKSMLCGGCRAVPG